MRLFHVFMGLALSASLAFAAPAFAAAPLANRIGMEFVLIPAGSFLMGSPEGEGNDDEYPQHRVNITRPFYLGKYEVTQGQWEEVMGYNPGKRRRVTLSGALTKDAVASRNAPVEPVSWDEVQEFIRRLNEREPGKRYRLPTEAEWEYACRAGTTTPWSFGDTAKHKRDYAWSEFNATTPRIVGQKRPNPWGLHDMHGNVFEWVQDRYDPAYYGRSPENDPQGPESGELRVMRGGSVFFASAECHRSAFRLYDAPDKPSLYVGFRLARDVED